MGDAKTYKMYIGGEWADATDGQTRKIVSPANGDVIAEVPEASAADVDRAVAAARKTYDETWSDATPGSGAGPCCGWPTWSRSTATSSGVSSPRTWARSSRSRCPRRSRSSPTSSGSSPRAPGSSAGSPPAST